MEALDDAVGLRTTHPGGAVSDLFELEEGFVGVAVGPSAELPSVVGENDLDLRAMALEGRQHIVIEGVDGGDGQLGGVEPRPPIRARPTVRRLPSQENSGTRWQTSEPSKCRCRNGAA